MARSPWLPEPTPSLPTWPRCGRRSSTSCPPRLTPEPEGAPGRCPGPHQEALPPEPPPRGEAPWDLLIGAGMRGANTAVDTSRLAPLIPAPMDRLQRASPFAGDPGGKATWRVEGSALALPQAQAPAEADTRCSTTTARGDRGMRGPGRSCRPRLSCQRPGYGRCRLFGSWGRYR